MKKILILLPFILVLVLGSTSCSNAEDKAYQRGYEEGYAEGRATSLAEGKSVGEKTAKTAIQTAQAMIANARDSGYEEGYQAGNQTSYDIGSKDGYDAGYAMGYMFGELDGHETGYQEGFDESTRLFGPKDELVKIISYELTRGSVGWVEVVGELQNLSNRTLNIEVTCALLNSNGAIVATNPSYATYRETLEPQQKAFFAFGSFYQQPEAVDVRFTITW